MTTLRLVTDDTSAHRDTGPAVETDRARADRVYGKIAHLIERELPTLRPGDADREALAYYLSKLRLRVPR